MKTCSKCAENKNLSDFYNRKDSVDKKQAWCKVCDKVRTDTYISNNLMHVAERKKQYALNNKEKNNTYYAQWRKNNAATSAFYVRSRYAKKLKATPIWANTEKIKDFYELAAQLKYLTLGIEYHVDHIIPLVNTYVCGLHVENNLQVLRKDKNLTKSNKLFQEVM